MNVDLDEDLEEQRPNQESVWTTLRRDPHWKCLILTLLMHGCLATITWCRVTEVTKVIINYEQYPIKSTWRVSPCDDGYIYIPLAFLVMLYLVYLVECWHCPARLDLHYGVSVSEVYEKLRLLRDALPVIWWKAICYHYIRRTRQVTRYRNGDAYTTTQVYYERINSHSSSATFVFSQCGVKDISKKLLDLEKFPATKIRFSKSFAFANLEAANEFEEQRSRFFQDNERHDDYMEMREGLDLTQGAFREGLTAFADRLPWYLSHAAFWLASAFLFSWPLRVLLTAKTAHVHYHVIKLFGVNYTSSSSVTGAPAAGSLIPTYGFLTPSGTVTSAELEWSIRNNFTVIPSYSEALLMEAESSGVGGGQRCSLLRHHSSGSVLVHHNHNNASSAAAPARTRLVRAFSSTGLAPPPAARRDSVRRQSTGRPHHRHSWGVFPCRGTGLRASVTRFSLQGERCVYHPLPLAEASPESSPALKERAQQPDDPPDYEVAIRVCRPLAPAPTTLLRRSVTERDLQHRTSVAEPSRRNSDATASSDIETAL